jgi:hypothetical protein
MITMVCVKRLEMVAQLFVMLAEELRLCWAAPEALAKL